MGWTSQAADKVTQIHGNLAKVLALWMKCWSTISIIASSINNEAVCGSICCHKHQANSNKWKTLSIFAVSFGEWLGEKKKTETCSDLCSCIDYVISGKLLRWTDKMCLELPTSPWAELGCWSSQSEKGESKSRVLILQVSVTTWFVGDSVAGTRALGFILHACFRNATVFRLMESFSNEIV